MKEKNLHGKIKNCIEITALPDNINGWDIRKLAGNICEEAKNPNKFERDCARNPAECKDYCPFVVEIISTMKKYN